MTTETRKRIRAYKKMLPELRERVIAVALLLAMSASMLGSASFAWITLSRSPEVSGMSTTVAANGNLEIALAQGSAKDPAEPPRESAVGDSSAAEGQNIVGANVTWGNLVNVSDPKYGLDQIALRPALLSPRALLVTPLEGAAYGEDGRVINTSDRYYYASWKEYETGEKRFASGDGSEYGVRAIASVMQENISGDNKIQAYKDEANIEYGRAADIYYGMVTGSTKLPDKDGNITNNTCITALQGIVEVYAQDTINDTSFAPDGLAGVDMPVSKYLFNFCQMLELMLASLEKEGEALVHLANGQAFIYQTNHNLDVQEKTFANIAELKANINNLSSMEINLVTLQQHLDDYELVKKSINEKRCQGRDEDGNVVPKSLKEIAEECNVPSDPSIPTYYWDDVKNAILPLVDISSVTIGGESLSGDVMSLATKILFEGGVQPVVISDGLLKDVEQRYIPDNMRMNADVSVKVTAKKIITLSPTVKGKVTTTAAGEPLREQDYNATGGVLTSGGESVGKETYGLALDLWLRTNYPNAVLTLEGAAEYTKVHAQHKGHDVFIMTYEEMNFDAYQDGDKWYYVDDDTEVPADIVNAATTEEKFDEIVTGYHGENRVWEDWQQKLSDGLIDKDATTQGAGSCFVFYADTPTEQEKLLEMLNSFTVAFIDGNGKNVATAKLNTKNAYINVGKVTVPLEVYDSAVFASEDEKEYGIMELQQNQPTRLTAVVYLNGKDLQNENVLSAGELNGQLNIQFGTNAVLKAPENEELMSQYRTIIASVTVGDETITTGVIDGDGNGLPYTAAGYNARVDLAVTGEQPERIEGFFVREINETQGTRGDTIEFTKSVTTDADGNEVIGWSANFNLKNPGTYVLNTLLVDGVQYNLHDGNGVAADNNHPKVKIAGLKLGSVGASIASGTYMTTNTSMPVTVTAEIETSLNLNSVQAQFFREGDSQQYNAILTRDVGNTWKGTVNINQSGKYSLSYISVAYENVTQTLSVPAPTNLNLYLGVNAQVFTSIPEAERVILLKNGESRQIPMTVRVYDDVPNMMTNELLKQVRLYYNLNDAILGGENKPLEMTWVPETALEAGHFFGYLNVDSKNTGTLSFNKLMISDKTEGTGSALTNVSGCPTFVIANFDPPTWASGSAPAETQLAINKNATMSVSLMNAMAQNETVTATFSRWDGTTTHTETLNPVGEPKTDSNTSITEFKFELAKEGIWTLEKVTARKPFFDPETQMSSNKLYTVYTAPAADDCVATAAEGEQTAQRISTKVIKNVYPKLTYKGPDDTAFADYTGAQIMLGVDSAGNKTADCFEEQETGTFTVTAYDFQNQKIAGLTSARWNFTHNAANQYDYSGYYISMSADGTPVGYKVPDNSMYVDYAEEQNKTDAAQRQMTIADNVLTMHEDAFIYGGDYTTELSLTFNDAVTGDHTFSTSAGMPKFAVKSKNPTVKVTGVSPASSAHTTVRLYNTATPGDSADLTTTMFSEVNMHTENTATVYMYATLKSGTFDMEAAHPKNPNVSLSMSGMSVDITSATMTFAHGTNRDYDAKFDFSYSNGVYTATKPIGGFKDGKDYSVYVDTWPVLYPAGKAEVDTVTVEYGGKTYEVQLENSITITNQLAPTVYADLTINETSYTGTKRIYSADGETITLPNTSWTQDGIDVDSNATDTGWVAGSTVISDYSYRTYTTGALFWKETHHEYMPYAWKEFTRTVTGAQTPYTTTYRIVKWTVNGQDYDVSKGPISIPADSAIQATATVTSQKVLGTKTTTSTTSYLYGYVQGTQTSTQPNGKQIGATVTSSSGAFIQPSYGIANTEILEHMYPNKTDYLNCGNRAK